MAENVQGAPLLENLWYVCPTGRPFNTVTVSYFNFNKPSEHGCTCWIGTFDNIPQKMLGTFNQLPMILLITTGATVSPHPCLILVYIVRDWVF